MHYFIFMYRQAMYGRSYVCTVFRCPNVAPASAFSFRKNTEQIAIIFGRGNHYHHQMNWLHFGRNCSRDNREHDATEDSNRRQTSAAT